MPCPENRARVSNCQSLPSRAWTCCCAHFLVWISNPPGLSWFIGSSSGKQIPCCVQSPGTSKSCAQVFRKGPLFFIMYIAEQMEKADWFCRPSTSDTLEVNAAVCCALDSAVIQISLLTPKKMAFLFLCEEYWFGFVQMSSALNWNYIKECIMMLLSLWVFWEKKVKNIQEPSYYIRYALCLVTVFNHREVSFRDE